MNIGIDIDGVLCSEDLFRLTCGTRFAYENKLNLSTFSPFSDEAQDAFGWSSAEDLLFWQTYYLYYLTTSTFLYPHCSKVIQALFHNNHKIFIISQRSQKDLDRLHINANMMDITRNWLCKNDIPYHQVILTDGEKSKVIYEKNISLMIDDNPQVLMTLSKAIKVIAFRALSNLETSLEDIPVVSSWKELEWRLKTLII